MRYLRSRFNGDIYEWNEQLAAHPQCEEITEKQAYPERFIPKKEVEAKGKPGRPRKGLSLDTAIVEVDTTPPELAKQAASGWPK